VSIPIDLERAQIVAALQLASMPILLHWADKGDPVLPSALQHYLASDVGTVHQVTLRQQLPLGEFFLTICDVGRIRSECRRNVNVGDQMWDTGRADFR
jgi:hypothetical protein